MIATGYVQASDLTVARVLLGIAIITVVARACGAAATRLRQPSVIGEIVAGLALGPSLLGLLPGRIDTAHFPVDIRPYLNVVAQLGLVLFMFVVGYDLHTGHLHGTGRAIGAISAASIVLPFALGFDPALAPSDRLPDDRADHAPSGADHPPDDDRHRARHGDA